MANVELVTKAGVSRSFEFQHALRILKLQDETKKVEWKLKSDEYVYVNGDLSRKKPEKLK